MKKVLAMLLALMMVLSMTACGGSSAPAEEPAEAPAADAPAEEAPAAPEETFIVGICQLVPHVALDAATQGFKDALVEALGDAVTFEDGKLAPSVKKLYAPVSLALPVGSGCPCAAINAAHSRRSCTPA